MKKLLLLFSALLFTATAFAQDYLWQEDFSSYAKNDVPEGGTYNYACTDGGSATKIYEEALAGGTSPELLVGKNGGSFAATIALGGKSGAFTLSYQCNRNISVSVSDGATLGTSTQSGNNYSWPVTVAEGTESITITFTQSLKSNARLDDIKFFQGEGKKAAGLSWGTASREVTIGSEENNFPTLTNGNSLEVTYASSNEEVATIDAEGTITLIAAGTTTISASYAGNDEYEAQTASYTLTVKAASTVDISNTPETAYTVAQANALIAANEGLDTKVYVKGTIVSVKEVSTSYGNSTYYISDDGTTTDQLTVYRGYYLGGEKFTAEDQIKAGDQVIVYGKLTNYNGTYEINSGNQIHSLNGTTTGIAAVKAQNGTSAAKAYTIDGRRAYKTIKGLYIIGGKKVLVK